MIAALYKSKRELKESVGQPLRFQETSLFGNEYKPDGKLTFVGPSATSRKFYGVVTMANGVIKKVE